MGDDFAMMREVLHRRFSPRAEGRPGPQRRCMARSGADRWRRWAAVVGAVGHDRAWARRDGGRRYLKGARARRRARAVFHRRARAVHARATRSGDVLPAAPARRGAPICHRHAPGQTHQGNRRIPRWTRLAASVPAANARCSFISDRRLRYRVRGLADLTGVPGISKAVAQKIYDHFHGGKNQ